MIQIGEQELVKGGSGECFRIFFQVEELRQNEVFCSWSLIYNGLIGEDSRVQIIQGFILYYLLRSEILFREFWGIIDKFLVSKFWDQICVLE